MGGRPNKLLTVKKNKHMKKTLSSLIIVLALLVSVVPTVSFAAPDCTIIPLPDACKSSGGPDVTKLMMSWGLTDGQTPKFGVGQTITDRYGNSFTCPWYYPKNNGKECSNIFETQYYLSQVKSFLNIK